MSNLNRAVSGIPTNEESARLLIEVGVLAMGKRAGYLPPHTDDSLLETETQFSERTKASRQSKWMRVTKWLQYLAFKHWDMSQGLPLAAFPQIEKVVYLESEAK